MPRAFAITAPTNNITLNDRGRGEVAFTVSNTSGSKLRGRAVVKTLGSTQSEAKKFPLDSLKEKFYPLGGP